MFFITISYPLTIAMSYLIFCPVFGGNYKYQNTPTAVPGTEVSEKATRRRFTAEYKRRIIKEADARFGGLLEV